MMWGVPDEPKVGNSSVINPRGGGWDGQTQLGTAQ